MRFSLLLIPVFFISAPVKGQDTLALDPVSISASLKPIKVSRTGRNILVIKGEEFNRLPIHSLDELLRYVPGVEVQSRGPMGSQSDIVIRGGTFQQVLVVLDGLRLNDPNSGHFTGYIPIAPAEIDRIEIVKGASSALYGSEAVGGVIHVITKSFAAKKAEEEKKATVKLTGGQYGLWSVNAGGYYNGKNTTLSGGWLSNNADGQPQRGTTGFFNNNTASISLGQRLNENLHLSVRSAYDKRDFSAQNFYTTFKSDTANETVQTFWNQLDLAFQKGADKFSFDAGFKKVKDRYAFNSAGVPNRNTSTLLQFLGNYEHAFGNHTTLNGGLHMQEKKILSNDRGDHTRFQAAGFIVLNKSFGDFSLMPALRVDHAGNNNTEWVPQMNVSYRKDNYQLRASAGKTIRQPDFTEQYNNYNKNFVASGSIGNPALEAEHSFSYEAGADLFIKTVFKISATAFRREQEKLIDWTPTPYNMMPRKTNLSPTGAYALAKNIASVNTSGAEADLQYMKSIPGLRLIARMGLLWLNSKSSDTIPSFYLSSHAKFSSNFSVMWQGDIFSFSINGLYKNRRAQSASAISAKLSPHYLVLNAGAEAKVWKMVSLFVQADNIFNMNYSDLLGSQMPRRWLMAGITLGR